MNETFLILDTETTIKGENMPNQSVFDIGWTISNRQGETICERSYIVEEFKYQALHRKKAFLLDSGAVDSRVYFTKLLNKEIKVLSWNNIIAQLKRDCKKYNVAFIGAYNLGFDTRVIAKTDFFFKGKDFTFFDDFFLIDLYHVCAYTVLNTDDYREFAQHNNLITDKGNYMTGAEPCYKYLFNELDYIEEHTAFKDSMDETRILHHILNQKEKIDLHAYSINQQAWRIVNSENY